MKKITIFLTFLLLTLFSYQSFAQCPNNNTPTGGVNFNATSLTVGVSTEVSQVSWGGEYASINSLTVGATYTVDTCGSNDDTYLTIYNSAGTQLGFNDNTCGDDASVTFTAPTTDARALVDIGAACGSNAANHFVNITLVSLPVPTCTEPTVPTVAATSNPICTGSSTTLNISGTLNDATAWHVYTGSCGGTSVGNTAGSTLSVSPTSTTTYFIRGEGGCATPGSCGQVTVTVNTLDNASFNYGSSTFCVDDSDPTPTITGLGGGAFSSTAGLTLNGASGGIDVSTSNPGTYAVTYTTIGICPNTSNVSVTINALDNASYSYDAPAYCQDDTDPTPSITGLAGGTFTSSAGLTLNPGTGAIDVSTSAPGAYTVTYTTAGACPNSSNVPVTVNALDDASFNYSAGSYCSADTDPTPTVAGLLGGSFSSAPGGLSITSGTGAIDVSTSAPGAYTVTYTTVGSCPNSSSVPVTVNALDDASFNYSTAAYCSADTDPTPTITGLAGGTFTSGAGLSINASTGVIDVSVSTPGTYTVTYTTAGVCVNSSDQIVTINATDDASFNYDAPAYCQDATDSTPTIYWFSWWNVYFWRRTFY
ncbi:Ig-like domain-containing protein [Lacinutrix jangbogonensis]|uniref:Ig-like domain-containing protein n=1 Tax=Lacinutrix jangbogonensis TaxID=1469557 RepID=UPI00053F0F04|nr:hypothetical protein [Lacinutrix jangbogonensis]